MGGWKTIMLVMMVDFKVVENRQLFSLEFDDISKMTCTTLFYKIDLVFSSVLIIHKMNLWLIE